MRKNIGLFLIFIIFAFFCAAGCGISSSSSSSSSSGEDPTPTSSNNVTISGNLGTTYAFYKTKWYNNIFKSAYASVFGTVKKAIAIPVINGDMDIASAKEITIQNDGSFQIDLSKTTEYEGDTYDQNYIILIEKNDGNINFLSIPKDSSDGSETLVNLPTSKATSNIELGTVNNNSNEAKSTLNLDELSGKVSYNVNELQSLATYDDVFKSAVNLYKNSYGKSDDEIIQERLHIVSTGDYSKINSEYSIANTLQGYAFHFSGGKNSHLAKNFEDICNNDYYLQLVPPANAQFEINSTTYKSSSPFKSKQSSITTLTDGIQQCGGDSGNLSYFRKETSGELIANFITGDNSDMLATTTPIPSGDFELKLNGTSIGKYDLSYNLPYTADNKLKTPIPSIKLDLDGDNQVKGVYVKWYINATNGEEEADLNTLKSIVNSFSIHMDDFNGLNDSKRLQVSCREIAINTSYVDISTCNSYQPLYYNYSSEDKYSLDDINVNLNFPNSELRFTYRKSN